MNYNQYDVYAQFLVRCGEVMGPFDLERLENDEAYTNIHSSLHSCSLRLL